MKKTLEMIAKIIDILMSNTSQLDKPEIIKKSKEESVKYKANSVGFGIGPTYGAGITYKRTLFGDKVGAQVSATPPLFDRRNLFFAGGATVFYNFGKVNKWVHPYLSLGAGGFYRRNKWTNTICPEYENPKPPQVEDPDQPVTIMPVPEPEPCYDEEVIDSQFGVGVGPALGIEFKVKELLTLNFELPCAIMWSDDGLKILPIPNFSFRVNV